MDYRWIDMLNHRMADVAGFEDSKCSQDRNHQAYVAEFLISQGNSVMPAISPISAK